jgi:hypothetical protein
MCVAAAEHERRKSTLTDADKAALLDVVIQRARDDLNDGQPLTEMRHVHAYGTIEGQSVPQCECGEVYDYDTDILARVGDSSGSRLSPVERRIAQAMERDKQFASFTVVRAAVADVLDAGGVVLPPVSNHPHPWIFGADEREEQTECRERFMDAVCARIVELQSPPHSMDARLLAELKQARKERV